MDGHNPLLLSSFDVSSLNTNRPFVRNSIMHRDKKALLESLPGLIQKRASFAEDYRNNKSRSSSLDEDTQTMEFGRAV